MNIFTLMGTILVDHSKAEESISKTGKSAEGLAGKLGEGLKKAAAIGATAMAAIGAVAAGMAVKAVSASDECQKALNSLQVQTGATSNEMDGLKESLLSIYGQNYGKSFEDVAQALANVKQQTGLAGQELEDFTTHALVLRDTFEMEVTESTRAADMMVKQFGLTGEEAFNLIAQGVQTGLDKNGNLLDSINEYSVHFSQLGLDAEDMFNMFSNGAEQGVFDIDKLGDAVKEFGIRVKDGTADEAFEQLGLSAEQLKAKFAEGGEGAKQAFDMVNQALYECDDKVLQNTLGVTMYGTMWEDMGADAVIALTNLNGEFDKTKATMDEINEIRYDSFGEAMEGIGRQIETGLLIPLGEKLLPKLNELANWVSAHMPEIQSVMGTAIETVGSVIENVGIAIQAMIPYLDEMIAVLAGVVTGFVAFETITTVTTIITTLTTTVTAAGGAMAALKVAMTAILTPTNIAAVAIGALVTAGVLLYQNWDEVCAFCGEVWEKVKNTITKAAENIKASLMTFINATQKAWEEHGGALKTLVDTAWANIKNIFETGFNIITDLFNIFKSLFSGNWSELWENVKKLVEDVWEGIKTFVDNTLTGIIDILEGIVPSMLSAGEGIFNAVWEGLKNVWENISNWVSDKVDWLADKLTFWDNGQAKMQSSGAGSADGSHRAGLSYVPYDGYRAELHLGERVLTKQEADEYEEGSTSTVINNTVDTSKLEKLTEQLLNAVDRIPKQMQINANMA